MAKAQTIYVCNECGTRSPRWMGRCDSCGNWNSIVEEVLDVQASRGVTKAKPGKPIQINEVNSVRAERVKTGNKEIDQVLGGGIVDGSLILIGGDPGIGKSTLVLEMAARLKNSLYISGEESERQIQLRAERMNIKADLMLFSETNLDTIIATIADTKPSFVVIDSIQTMYSADIPGTPGSVSQLSLCASRLMNFAKEHHVPILIIGHVTKEGNLAGPRVLEHLVDVVLYLEGDRFGEFRILRCVKNRFGSTNEVGIFEMKAGGLVAVENPSELMIAEKAVATPGSVIFPAMEGTRPLLVEIQALTSSTSFGYPKRTSSGFDLNRLNLLAAVLAKRCGLNLATQDIFLNVAGGVSIREPGADLAVCLSISSVYKGKNIPDDMVIFGEVGLAGEVRSVNNIEKRIKEAEKLGFKKAVIAKSRFTAPKNLGINIITVATVREAIEKVL